MLSTALRTGDSQTKIVIAFMVLDVMVPYLFSSLRLQFWYISFSVANITNCHQNHLHPSTVCGCPCEELSQQVTTVPGPPLHLGVPEWPHRGHVRSDESHFRAEAFRKWLSLRHGFFHLPLAGRRPVQGSREDSETMRWKEPAWVPKSQTRSISLGLACEWEIHFYCVWAFLLLGVFLL